MGEHRFSDAITYAQKALALGSGDLSSFAIVGDANADMGEYERAAIAYSRLDISGESASQPRNVYVRDSRTSYLKFVSGDTAGAIRLMQSAVAAGTEARLPAENLAWLYYELGEYEFQAGDIGAANNAYLTALNIHPGDYRALAGLGKLRGNQGRYAEAIKLYQSAIAVVPMPMYVAELGDLYTKAGNPAEAKKQYQLVEYIGLLGHINQVLHNRDLALFYADHDIKLDESLALAHKEFEVRHDIYTWDALAWALYKNGKYQEASDAIDNALRPGARDALLFFHAGMIAGRLGQNALGQRAVAKALSINPQFHVIYSDVATAAIEVVTGASWTDREPRTKTMFRKRLYCFLSIALCLWLAPRGFAHPMGNFSVNHYSKISLERDGIKITYIIDLAEIPTYQELQQGNVTADVADPAVTRFVALRGAEFGRGLSLMLDGKRLPLRLLSSQVIFPPGAGGLPTMKMGFVYQAAYPAESLYRWPAVC